MIDEMGGAFRHAPAAAARTEPSALGGKRDHSIVSTRVAMKPRKPGRETPASEKLPELLLDEPGQAFAVSQGRRLGAEGLEVLEDETVEHAVCRAARLVRGRGPGHVNGRGRPRASVRIVESCLNS